ncbi:hypothetical protein NHL50_09770 [Acidimicrobiia bacterium EGI L10123]|uniref:hypothetical protein n=1 Tax=Salinilacustrithrix flava TaxID=2957203 RepID=UPI003D7C3205|nr:hypothetical protein [Acidimicrobiia bacterium EGI L10123]
MAIRWGRALAVAAAIAVAASACSNGDDDEQTQRNEATVEAEPAAALVDDDGPFAPTGDQIVDVDAVGALYSGNVADVPDGITATAAPEPDPVEGILAAGPGMHVEVPGPFTGTFEIHLAIADPPTDTAIPGILHQRHDGTYVLEPGLWNPDTGTVIAGATSFSTRWAVWYDAAQWVTDAAATAAQGAVTVVGGGIDFVADFVTGRTDPPPCRNDPPSWATTTFTEAASVHVCSQSNDDGATSRTELFLKSNRRTAQVVTVASGHDYLWAQDQDSDAHRKVLAWAARVEPGSNLVLLGEHEMSIGFRRPAFTMAFDTRAYQTWTLIVANPILAALGNLPAKTGTALAVSLASYRCAQEISGIDVFSVDITPNDLGPAPEAIGKAVRCGFELIQEPELVGGIAREALGALGITGRDARAVLGQVDDAAAKLAPTAARIAAALAGGSVLTNSFDGLFDNAAEGLITTTMTGTLSEETLLPVANCQGPCTVSGRVTIDHPRWGPTHLITIGPDGLGNFCADRILFAVDDRGEVVWDSGANTSGCPWYAMAPAGQGDHGSDVARPVDAAGRIFFDWDPGRYNGVAVLAVTDDGFEDYGTLPSPDYTASSHYYAYTVDVDGDGTYEIEQHTNTCQPTCAGGFISQTLYRFDRDGFVGVPGPPDTRCGAVWLGEADGFGAYASDVADGITVTGVTCVEALYGSLGSGIGSSLVDRIAGAHTPYQGDATFSAEGLSCTVTDVEGSAYEFYDCSDGTRAVSFDRYVEP